MAKKLSLGAMLVENFNLLLEYAPDKECAQHVKESMLSLPDKHAFRSIMSYVLYLIDPNWKSHTCARILTKQDERLFYNELCKNLKTLKREFPGRRLPLLTPSSMVCFHGEKYRDILLEITNVLMLKVMKMEHFDVNVESKEDDLYYYEQLRENNTKMRDEVARIGQGHEKIITQLDNIISVIFCAGNVGENLKTKIYDHLNHDLVAGIKKERNDASEELNVLKKNLQPFFDHISHEINEEFCRCSSTYHLSSEVVSKICELLCDLNKKVIESHIEFLKSASQILEGKTAFEDDFNASDRIFSELISKLENMTCDREETQFFSNSLLSDSPFAIKEFSPSGSIVGFSPVVAPDWLKLKNQGVKLNVDGLIDYIAPVKVKTSPSDPLNCHVLPRASGKREVGEESISSIVQRMRENRPTPYKFSKQFGTPMNNNRTSHSSLLSSISKTSMSVTKGLRNTDRFTPATKYDFLVSKSTNRRQSMGFVKPSYRTARRQLNSYCSPEKKLSTHFEWNAKSDKLYVDPESDFKVVMKKMNPGGNNSNNELLSEFGILSSRESQLDGKLASVSKQQTSAVIETVELKENVSCLNTKNVFMERQIKTCQSLHQHKSPDFGTANGHSPEPKEIISDKILDKVVQQMVEDDSFLCSRQNVTLDSSLSGVDSLPSPSTDVMFPNKEELCSSGMTANISRVLTEMLDEENELNNYFKSLIEGEESVGSLSDELSILNPTDVSDISIIAEHSLSQNLMKSNRKSGRNSLGLLIERFKAIKRAHNNE